MKHRWLYLVAAGLLATTTVPAAETSLETEEQKVVYAIGLALSRSLTNYGLSTEQISVLQSGLEDGILGREPRVALETYGPKIEDFLSGRRAAVVEKEKEAGNLFRGKVAQEPGAVVTESGMIYFEQKAGDGETPSETDTVKVHYHGTFADGNVFDTSRQEGGEPAQFAMKGVVPCFSEGIGRMKAGGRSKLVCPPELAYGDRGFPPMIAPGVTLVFEVELLEVIHESEPETAPQIP